MVYVVRMPRYHTCELNLNCLFQVVCAMAMTSVRLPSSILRKPDAWIGLCRALRGTPSHKGCASWNRYLYLSSAKLNASNYKTLLHNIFSLRLPGLLISPEYIFPFSIRLKSNISSKKSTKKTLQKVEDEGDSDEERDEMSELEEEPEDNPSEVKDYKDLDKAVQSFRYDVILKTGLDIGRKYVRFHTKITCLLGCFKAMLPITWLILQWRVTTDVKESYRNLVQLFHSIREKTNSQRSQMTACKSHVPCFLDSKT